MKDIVWFSYQDDKSDVWNIEFFMRELYMKFDLLIENSNLIAVMKSYNQYLGSYLNKKDNIELVNYFRRQKIRDIQNDTNLYYNLNIGNLKMAGFTDDALKSKINFLQSQWQLIPEQINLKSYEVVTRLLGFTATLQMFTEVLRLFYPTFSNMNLFISLLNSDLWEIYRRLTDDWDLVNPDFDDE